MHRAFWSAVTLALMSASCWRRQDALTSFRPLPAIVATLPGEETEFSRELDGRIRERFPIGTSEDKLIDFLASENFVPDWRRRDTVNSSSFVESGLICRKIVRVRWRADAAGLLTEVGGVYESHCL